MGWTASPRLREPSAWPCLANAYLLSKTVPPFSPSLYSTSKYEQTALNSVPGRRVSRRWPPWCCYPTASWWSRRGSRLAAGCPSPSSTSGSCCGTGPVAGVRRVPGTWMWKFIKFGTIWDIFEQVFYFFLGRFWPYPAIFWPHLVVVLTTKQS